MSSHHQSVLFASATRGIFAAVGSDFLQKILGFAATAILLAVLTVYEYGLWQLLLSVLTALDVLLFPSIAGMLIADISREIGSGRRSRAGAIVVRAVPVSLALGLLGSALMFLGAPLASSYSGIDLTLWIRILAFALIAEGISQAFQMILQGTLSLVHAQVLKASKRLFYVAGVVLFALFLDWDITGIVLAYTLSIFLPVLFYTPLVIRRFFVLIRDRESEQSHFIEAAWVRGRWSLAGDVAGAASASLWPWIIGYFLSIEEMGIISLAILVIGQVASIAPVSFVLRSVLPRTLATDGRTRAWLARSTKYAVWSQLIGGVFVIGLGAVIIPTFFSSYISVLPLAAAILLVLPIRAMGVAASEWFYAAGRQRTLFLVSSLPKLLLLALLPLFLANLGVFGFVLWYLLNAEIITYLRLRLISREEGGVLKVSEVLFPDREDSVIFGRVLDSLYKIRYTRV